MFKTSSYKALGTKPEKVRRTGKNTARLATATILVATSLLGGCASYQKDHFRVGSVPSDYRTNHPIVVSQNDIVTDLAVVATDGRMSSRNDGLVREFASRFRKSGAKSMKILVPNGARNEMAARRIARKTSRLLQEDGIPAKAIRILGYQAEGPAEAATVRLVFSSLSAQVASECGQWDEDLTFDPENRNYKNFGCATQNNLASMIANPADLVSPRGQSEIDAERRNNTISDWRENGSASLPSQIN